ncbi:hypothetical protein LTR62_003976 [Meristemomyces frigidus]|uniref:Stress response protein NST1 n=1 Tax=Meristemomyces frigidus TaxID=1508187 RepID=A0AAN7TWI5_9PEZI|nr:hypothetical protein LTR62_003976 [Meristemomyces frigidus]
MATTAKVAPPLLPNGVITAPPNGVVGGNRKKQKRRAKQAAKVATQPPSTPGQPADLDYEEDALGYGEDDYAYSDADGDEEPYADQYLPPHPNDKQHHHHHDHGFDMPPPPIGKRSRKKKKGSAGHSAYDPSLLPPLPNPPHPHHRPHSHPHPTSNALRSMHHKGMHHHDDIWNTSTAQERQNIKEFWLSLSEEERKSLLKIEKEAVLRKMKQQQKHSCSCTVCGRKRTAIEEELEVLYEGYYEELEQYAHHDTPPLPSVSGLMPDPLQHHRPHPLAAPPPRPQHRTSALHEHLDEDGFSDEEEEEDDEEEYSDEDEEGYSDEEVMPEPPRAGVPDFFNFGQNLTVKGILTPWLEKLQQGLKGKADNLLTVADDLLKNDGRKFIEMMEQLAERRMQRESEAEYAAQNPRHPEGYPPDPGYNHEDSMAANEQYDDDEASYDSQEDYDDDMDDESETVSSREWQMSCAILTRKQGGLTEEQRMQEGRRMFQIFAARMFEQRVLNAYREKVSAERQAKLLEELEGEDQRRAEKEAKKARDAQKKKEKKKQQQQAKAEEKARKDAEKAEEEAKLREAEEKRSEEQRRRKEEQRKKKEEEKRKLEEEKAKKDADKTRRLQEEAIRREQAEQKARDLRALEKAKKLEQQKARETQEQEAREAKERKAQEEKDRKEREAKDRADEESKRRERTVQKPAQQPQQLHQITKRPSQIGMVAVPGMYAKQTPSGISSPHLPVATPALPKAATPAKARQPSQQGSHASSPKQANSHPSSAPSKTSSPGNGPGPQHPQHQYQATQPKTIMQKPSNQHVGPHHHMQTASPLHQHPMQPPPGMQQHHPSFAGMTPMGFPFQGPQPPMMHGNMGHRGPMPMYPQQHGLAMGMPNRMPYNPNMNGMPPPGMMQPQVRGMSFGFDAGGPPGFNRGHPLNQNSMIHHQMQQQPDGETPRAELPAHSRQPSGSEKDRFDINTAQPIARPAPIQRPSSVKPLADERKGSNTDLDDLSKHLGSSALLADDDEPLPTPAENRRHSGMQNVGRNAPPVGLGNFTGFGSVPGSGFGGPGSNWNSPSLPFGPGSAGLGQQNWAAIPPPGMNSWTQNQSSFAANGGFGSLGSVMQPHRPTGTSLNRPLTIRLAVCQACKQLSAGGDSEANDDYHPLSVLLRQIEGNRPMLDSPPTLREIEEICETEGDTQNGGGELYIRRSSGAADSANINGSSSESFAVKWEPDAATTADASRGAQGLGEIGSPMPAKLSPAFGAPGRGRQQQGFQSLGAVGTSTPGF